MVCYVLSIKRTADIILSILVKVVNKRMRTFSENILVVIFPGSSENFPENSPENSP